MANLSVHSCPSTMSSIDVLSSMICKSAVYQPHLQKVRRCIEILAPNSHPKVSSHTSHQHTIIIHSCFAIWLFAFSTNISVFGTRDLSVQLLIQSPQLSNALLDRNAKLLSPEQMCTVIAKSALCHLKFKISDAAAWWPVVIRRISSIWEFEFVWPSSFLHAVETYRCQRAGVRVATE